MSRFKGWTSESIKNLPAAGTLKIIKHVKKADTIKPNYIAPIVNALKLVGITAVIEYRFLHDRRFRFDIAIPGRKIAIEFEGGIFRRGRHTRGKGYSNDCKKYNLAVQHGWKLLRYTPDRTKKINWEFEIASEVKELISSRQNAR